MTDFDEYEALEAEAEALATAQQPAAQPVQSKPISQPVAKSKPAAPVAQKKEMQAQEPAQKQTRPANVPEPQKVPRYIAIHQPERIYIVDTQTEEIISEGFKDDGIAMGMAKLMNDQDTLIVGAGYQ